MILSPIFFFIKRHKVLAIIFFIGLLYLLLPGPGKIDDFPAIPNSVKSDLEGDTIQNPNIAAYFSDFVRDDITKYYKSFFSKSVIPGIPLPVISINRPPEEAYLYVRDQQESTFLEEYIFPLREHVYVNGYEPKIENDIYAKNKRRSWEGDRQIFKGNYYLSKTTLRFYPSAVIERLVIYFGIWLAGTSLFIVFKNSLREKS